MEPDKNNGKQYDKITSKGVGATIFFAIAAGIVVPYLINTFIVFH